MSTKKTTKMVQPAKRAKKPSIAEQRHAELMQAVIDLSKMQDATNARLDRLARAIEKTNERNERTHELYREFRIGAFAMKDLLNEVNAHMWQTQNRLNAVRDVLWKRDKEQQQAMRTIWQRIAQWWKENSKPAY